MQGLGQKQKTAPSLIHKGYSSLVGSSFALSCITTMVQFCYVDFDNIGGRGLINTQS